MADKTTLHKVEIKYVPAALIGQVFMKASRGDPEAFLAQDKLELVDMPGFDGNRRPVTHPKNLATIYKHYQRIDDTQDERTTQLKQRSMSVGDAIVYNRVTYYVVEEKGKFATKDASGELIPVTEENCVPAAIPSV